MKKRSHSLSVQKLLDSSISVSFLSPPSPELNTFLLGLQGPSGGLISCSALSVLHSDDHPSTHSLACRILLMSLQLQFLLFSLSLWIYSFVVITLLPFQEGTDIHGCAHSTYLPEDSPLLLAGLRQQLVATAVIHTSESPPAECLQGCQQEQKWGDGEVREPWARLLHLNICSTTD